MKINKLNIQGSNVNIADKIDLTTQNLNWGLDISEIEKLAAMIKKLPEYQRVEISNLMNTIKESPENIKEDGYKTFKTKLIDFGISLSASLTSQGLLQLFSML